MITRTIRSVVLAALVATPTGVLAHPRLTSSLPAANDTVRTRLASLRLTFSEPVDTNYTSLILIDAAGNEYTTTLKPARDNPRRQLEFGVSASLPDGILTARWKAAGSDGHAVTGDYFIVIVSQPAAALSMHAPSPAHHAPAAALPSILKPESSPLWALTRWLNFIALVLMLGAVVFRFGILDRLRAALDSAATGAAYRRATILASTAAIVGIVSNLARAALQSGSLHGPDRMWDIQLIGAMLTRTTWGIAWLIQTSATGLYALLLSRPSAGDRRWIGAALCAAAIAPTPAFSGHANAVTEWHALAIGADSLHVVGAAGWLGCLAFVLFAGLPAAHNGLKPDADVARLILAFSPVALVMAGIAVSTGVLSAVLHFSSLHLLWTTPYGKALLIKVAIVLTTAATGAYNWRIVTPRLGTPDGTAHLKKSAGVEVFIAIAVIAITAVLVASPTP